MARAGITKYSVEKARNTLIGKGVNPSIDAIRVALGNTGSKTTISRYLKDIETEESVQLEDEALLSEGIKEIIAKLAARLHQEANEIVSQSENRYQGSLNNLTTENKTLREELSKKADKLDESKASSIQLNRSNQSLESEIGSLKTELNQSIGQAQELNSVLQEKDKQIQALNENHQHTRENLQHYRESIKEQREQEHRQHEQQIQQLQGEIRQLNQTLIVKQTNITELNKDNSRLITELSNVQKNNIAIENQIAQRVHEVEIAKANEQSIIVKVENTKSMLKELTNKNAQLIRENEAYTKSAQDMSIKLVQLETELKVKDELLANFSQTTSLEKTTISDA